MESQKEISINRSISFGFSEVGKYPEIIILVFLYSLIVYFDDYFNFMYSNYIFHFSIKFSIPWAFPTFGSFYDFPQRISGVSIFGGYMPFFGFRTMIPFMFVGVVIESLLAAGTLAKLYYGSILKQSITFSQGISKFFLRIFMFKILILGLVIISILITMAAPVIGLIAIFWMFIIAYVLFLTPYIIVEEDSMLNTALRKSVELAFTGRIISYVIIFALITAICSMIISFLLMFPWIGFGISLAIIAYVGTALTISTLHYYDAFRRSTQ